jgi:hypothetical protein
MALLSPHTPLPHRLVMGAICWPAVFRPSMPWIGMATTSHPAPQPGVSSAGALLIKVKAGQVHHRNKVFCPDSLSMVLWQTITHMRWQTLTFCLCASFFCAATSSNSEQYGASSQPGNLSRFAFNGTTAINKSHAMANSDIMFACILLWCRNLLEQRAVWCIRAAVVSLHLSTCLLQLCFANCFAHALHPIRISGRQIVAHACVCATLMWCHACQYRHIPRSRHIAVRCSTARLHGSCFRPTSLI